MNCDDAPQSDVMVNFSGPGVAEPARNEASMPVGGDSVTYGVGAASNWSRRWSNWSRRSSNRSRRGSNRSSRGRGDDSRRRHAVGCDCRFCLAHVKAMAVMASVAVAAVVVTTVVAAAVATLLLLGAAVSVVVKMGVMQTAPISSSLAARS